MKPQLWKHHFSIEFRPPNTPHTMVDGARWFRKYERQGFRAFYVRDEADADLTLAVVYGTFRQLVDNMPEWAVAVRLVERNGEAMTEHVRYFPGKDPPVKGATMTWDEVREQHRLYDQIMDEFDALDEKRERLKTGLIVESLRRLRADVKDEDDGCEISDDAVESGRVVADSGWECTDVERNVYGFCIYDDDEDPCHDNCLFCHEPKERK